MPLVGFWSTALRAHKRSSVRPVSAVVQIEFPLVFHFCEPCGSLLQWATTLVMVCSTSQRWSTLPRTGRTFPSSTSVNCTPNRPPGNDNIDFTPNFLDSLCHLSGTMHSTDGKLIQFPKGKISSNIPPFLLYSQIVIINSEFKHLFSRVEGGDSHWRLCKLHLVTGEQSPRKVVGWLRPGSQIRRFTPVYKWLNDGVRARGDNGGYRWPFC